MNFNVYTMNPGDRFRPLKDRPRGKYYGVGSMQSLSSFEITSNSF